MKSGLRALLLFAGLGVLHALCAAGESEQVLDRALDDPGMLDDHPAVSASVEHSRRLAPSFHDGDKHYPSPRLSPVALAGAHLASLRAATPLSLHRPTYLITQRLRI